MSRSFNSLRFRSNIFSKSVFVSLLKTTISSILLINSGFRNFFISLVSELCFPSSVKTAEEELCLEVSFH